MSLCFLPWCSSPLGAGRTGKLLPGSVCGEEWEPMVSLVSKFWTEGEAEISISEVVSRIMPEATDKKVTQEARIWEGWELVKKKNMRGSTQKGIGQRLEVLGLHVPHYMWWWLLKGWAGWVPVVFQARPQNLQGPNFAPSFHSDRK